VVFPVLHGSFGEDGTLQGLFEMAEVAYVGAGVLASALAMDKGVFKDIMRAHEIPVLDSIVVTRREITLHLERVLAEAQQVGPYPLFTKPANMGSSVGVSKVRVRADLMEGLMEAAQYDRRILVERGIEAREIEVSVLGNEQPEASIPGEVVPAAEFYTYEAKYHDERSELLIPAPLTATQRAQVQDYALRAYKAIDCAGMARVDFLLEKGSGRVYLSEINTIPGFTRISMYPKLWEASGLPYPALADRLIDLALERRTEQAQTTRKFERGQTA
jgi:D-alanine-D-alanine ligase